MRTYIEACVNRVIAAHLSTDAPCKVQKRYIHHYPVILIGFADRNHPRSLRRGLLIDDIVSPTYSPDKVFPYVPFMVATRLIVTDRDLGAEMTDIPSTDHFYYRHDLAYHYATAMGETQDERHDFHHKTRYTWFLPVRHFQPFFLQELDYVLYHLICHPQVSDRVLPGLFQQLTRLGGYDEKWADTMMGTLHMTMQVKHRERRFAQLGFPLDTGERTQP